MASYEDVFTLKQSHQILNAGKKRKYVGKCLRNPFFCLLKIYHTGVQLIYTYEAKQVSNFLICGANRKLKDTQAMQKHIVYTH